jgi:hypothetical protein
LLIVGEDAAAAFDQRRSFRVIAVSYLGSVTLGITLRVGACERHDDTATAFVPRQPGLIARGLLLTVQSLEAGLARTCFNLAAIQDLTRDLSDGHAATALREVGGVTKIEETFAVVIADALHPVLFGRIQGALLSDPLGTEAAHAIKARATPFAITSPLRR